MTALLEKAIKRASALPEAEQEAIGALILEEIASEARWDTQFAASPDTLAKLASEALAEFNAGKTQPFEQDRDFAHD